MMCFITKATPIIIIDLASVELLHKLTELLSDESLTT